MDWWRKLENYLFSVMLKLESLCFPPRANFMSIQTPGNYTQILFSFAFFNIYVSDSMLYIFFTFFLLGKRGKGRTCSTCSVESVGVVSISFFWYWCIWNEWNLGICYRNLNTGLQKRKPFFFDHSTPQAVRIVLYINIKT